MAYYKTDNKKAMHRVNTRLRDDQVSFVKSEVKKSKGTLTDGDVYRLLIDEAITNRKKK